MTRAPPEPLSGEIFDINGLTVKKTEELEPAGVVTMRLFWPTESESGTFATIWLSPQEIMPASSPPMVTVDAPWEVPKFVPVIVMVVPTGPLEGETPDILGRSTLNSWILLEILFTMTITS